MPSLPKDPILHPLTVLLYTTGEVWIVLWMKESNNTQKESTWSVMVKHASQTYLSHYYTDKVFYCNSFLVNWQTWIWSRAVFVPSIIFIYWFFCRPKKFWERLSTGKLGIVNSDYRAVLVLLGKKYDTDLPYCDSVPCHYDFEKIEKKWNNFFHLFFQIQFLSQECQTLIIKPNFPSILCYTFENPDQKQKTLKPSTQLLPNVSRTLKLNKVQEVCGSISI